MIRTQSPPSRARAVQRGRSVVVHSDSYLYARWVLFMMLLVILFRWVHLKLVARRFSTL